jgi:hypothetical protein
MFDSVANCVVEHFTEKKPAPELPGSPCCEKHDEPMVLKERADAVEPKAPTAALDLSALLNAGPRAKRANCARNKNPRLTDGSVQTV